MEKDPKKIEELEKIHAKFLGRPTKYTEELGAKICDMLATGKSIKQIEETCDVTHATWELWRDTIPSFSTAYRRARKLSVRLRMDQLSHIADDDSNDILYDKDGRIVINSAGVGRSRERAGAIKQWLGYVRGCQIKALANAKTADEVMTIAQAHLEDGEISYDEAEKLAKLAETRMKCTELEQVKASVEQLKESLK